MSRAVGYIRVSTQGQVREGYRLAYQRDEITRHCVSNGIELIRLYEDKGISGAKVDEDGLTVEREGLQEMLADLESQNASHAESVATVLLNKLDTLPNANLQDVYWRWWGHEI